MHTASKSLKSDDLNKQHDYQNKLAVLLLWLKVYFPHGAPHYEDKYEDFSEKLFSIKGFISDCDLNGHRSILSHLIGNNKFGIRIRMRDRILYK